MCRRLPSAAVLAFLLLRFHARYAMLCYAVSHQVTNERTWTWAPDGKKNRVGTETQQADSST